MLDVKLQDKPLEYGDEFNFVLSWYNDEQVRSLEAVLGYSVRTGKQEVFYPVAAKTFEYSPREGRETVTLPIPEGPRGCNGIAIRVEWQLEVIMKPGKEVLYVPLSIGGGNLQLQQVTPPDLDYPKRLRPLVGIPKKKKSS